MGCCLLQRSWQPWRTTPRRRPPAASSMVTSPLRASSLSPPGADGPLLGSASAKLVGRVLKSNAPPRSRPHARYASSTPTPSAQFAASSLRSLHAAAFAADTAEEAFSLGEHGEALFSEASPSERYWIQDRPAAAIADLDAVRRKSKLPRSAREAGFRDRLPRGCHGPFYALRAEADSASLSHLRAVSSVGRAPARQAGGHWFEPSTAHRKGPEKWGLSGTRILERRWIRLLRQLDGSSVSAE